MSVPSISRGQRVMGIKLWQSGWRCYALVLGAVGSATALRWALAGVLGNDGPLITFYPAVALVCILLAGGKAGLLATLLSAALAKWLFMPPQLTLGVSNLAEVYSLGLFTAAGVLMSLMAGMLGRAQERESQALQRESLAESRSKLAAIVESSEDAIVSKDLAGTILSWNAGAQRLFGYRPEEMIGRSITRIVPPELHDEELSILERLRRGESNICFETVRLTKHGRRIPVSLTISPIRDAAAAVIGASKIARDITERKRAEEALRRAEEHLVQAVRLAGLGTFEHDHRSDLITLSPVLRQLLGLEPDQQLTLDGFLASVLPEDRATLAEAIRGAHDPAGSGLFAVEYRVPHPQGGIRWLSARSQTLFEGDASQRRPVRTIGAVLDITERKEIQAHLERLVGERTARLEELVAELEHFSYSITHDLKAPLRAMRSFAEIASRLSGDGVRPEVKEALAKIATSAQRMDGLIADALHYSQAIRQDLPLVAVDTDQLVRGMLDTYPELQPQKAHIQVQGKLPVVLGNEAGLTQCFSNLLDNAVKFVRPGEKPRIRISAEQCEGWARISIEDKGIGISKEMLPRLFEMFSRESKAFEGTGIGLALVRKVAQRMGGRVGVESETGKGSRFWLELKPGQAPPGSSRAEPPPSAPGTGTVLYVEDEESDVAFMRMAFAEKGMESALRVVCDGRAAIDYLSGAGKYADRQAHPLPSVVLLDLNLPRVPGFDVLKWMRTQPEFARTPVVVFSASTREDDQRKALQLGANEFLTKPSSGLKFGDVLDALIDKWLPK